MIVFSLISCGVHPTERINSLVNNTYIGMSESEFKAQVRNTKDAYLEIIRMEEKITIYKVNVTTYNAMYGSNTDHRFFYFFNGKLDKIDRGVRR